MKNALLTLIFCCLAFLLHAQQITADIQPDAVYFTENSDSILVYQGEENSINGTYARCNYIHPLYLPDGQVLTEDFPADHLHHRGIFWAWHQLYIGDKRIGDGWDIRNFSWEVDSVQVSEKADGAQALKTQVLWKSPDWKNADESEKPVVKESTTITVYPLAGNYRQIDFTISLLALEKNMRIGGSENEKGYGGFTTRIQLADIMVFTGPAGSVIPDNLPVESDGWIDISGPIGKEGTQAGITIMSHPDNPGFPNPWILRASGSAQNAVYPHPGAVAVPLSDSIPTVLRYRLLVHEGNSGVLDIPEIYSDYTGD